MRSHLKFLGKKTPRASTLSYFIPVTLGRELNIDHLLPLWVSAQPGKVKEGNADSPVLLPHSSTAPPVVLAAARKGVRSLHRASQATCEATVRVNMCSLCVWPVGFIMVVNGSSCSDSSNSCNAVSRGSRHLVCKNNIFGDFFLPL